MEENHKPGGAMLSRGKKGCQSKGRAGIQRCLEFTSQPKKKEEDTTTPDFLPISDIFSLSLLLDVKMLNI